MRVLMSVLCLAAAVAAQDTGRLEGRVISNTGQPVAKATVRVQGGQRAYIEVTAADGTFAVEGMAPGMYSATAQRVGYMSIPSIGPAPIVVSPGQTARGVEVRLNALGAVRGTVVDADGTPVMNANVRLMRTAFLQGRSTTQIAGQVQTNDLGEFRLANIPPGRYVLSASLAQQAITDMRGTGIVEVRGASAQLTDLDTFYPDAADLKSATALTVGSAPLENVRVKLRRGRTFVLRGTVAGEGLAMNGPLRPNVQVFLKNGDANPVSGFVLVQNTGEFTTAALAPGEYRLMARMNDPANPNGAWLGQAEFTIVDQDVNGFKVQMAPPLPVTGRITAEGVGDFASFMAGVSSTRLLPPGGPGVTVGYSGPTLSLMPTVQNVNIGQVPTNADGTLQRIMIAPVAYTLNISNLGPGMFVKSVRLNGNDVTRKLLDLTGAKTANLEVVLGLKPGSLTLKAPAGWTFPSPGGTTMPVRSVISVWPTTPDLLIPNGSVKTAFLNPTGQTMLNGLPPGEYFAVLWEEPPASDLMMAPLYLERFQGNAVRVQVGEGEAKTIEVPLVPAAISQKVLSEFP